MQGEEVTFYSVYSVRDGRGWAALSPGAFFKGVEFSEAPATVQPELNSTQVLPAALGQELRSSLQPRVADMGVKTAMDFFTYRFLYGASILSSDLRKRTWMKARNP